MMLFYMSQFVSEDSLKIPFRDMELVDEDKVEEGKGGRVIFYKHSLYLLAFLKAIFLYQKQQLSKLIRKTHQ